MTPASAASSEPTFFLIVGSGRCGSTLLSHLLSQHPQIVITNEARAYDFLHFSHQLAQLPDHRDEVFAFETPNRLRGIVTDHYTNDFSLTLSHHIPFILLDFYKRVFPGRNFTHYGDKMSLPIPALHASALVPGSKLIALIRDPRDYVCSAIAYSKHPDIANNYPSMQTTIESFCKHWSLCAQGMYDLGLKPIRYEDLVAYPATALRAALRTLGLEWHPKLDEATSSIAFATGHATSASARASIGRWQKDLPPSHVDLVQQVCGNLMSFHGYESAAH